MTEQAETPKILDEISKSNSAKASSRISRKQQTARRRFVVVLAILFPIIAGVLLLGYQQISVQSQLAQMTVDNQQLTQNLEQQTALTRELEQNWRPVRECYGARRPRPVDGFQLRRRRYLLREVWDGIDGKLLLLTGTVVRQEFVHICILILIHEVMKGCPPASSITHTAQQQQQITLFFFNDHLKEWVEVRTFFLGWA